MAHLDASDRIVRAWVKLVRDVAYDAEDSLREFAARVLVATSQNSPLFPNRARPG
jgi:hypothetical protein